MNKFGWIGQSLVRLVITLVLSAVAVALMGGGGSAQSVSAPVAQTVGATDTQHGGAQLLVASGCYDNVGNMAGAWPAAYLRCTSGTGHYKVKGGFRRWDGTIYYGTGPCVGIGKTSTVYSGALFEKAVSSGKVNC